MNFSNTLKES